MQNSIKIIVPANRSDLLKEFENSLGRHATTLTNPTKPTNGQVSFTGVGIAEITLVFDFLAKAAETGTAIAGATVTIAEAVERLMGVIDRIKQRDRDQADKVYIEGQNGENRRLKDIDEAWLGQQLGDPFAAFRKRL